METKVVLRLLNYTAPRFPGVFSNGRPAEVIRVIGRILPLFAEPDYQSIIFEPVWSLLSLLRTDLQYVASKHTESGCLLKCFCGSFSDILESTAIFSDLPERFQPKNGPGVLIDLSGDMRWCSFATSLIRLINKCLTDGTLHVEGIVTMPFVSAACSILCYGDESLHKVCFDFARIVATVMTVEILPTETIVRSITSILRQDVNELSSISLDYYTPSSDVMWTSQKSHDVADIPQCNSNVEKEFVTWKKQSGNLDPDYDLSMGACLNALHSSCPGYIVESTAADIVNVFTRAVQTSRSSELQAAMCNAYMRIVEVCSPQVWKPEILLKLLYLPKPYDKVTECIRLVVDKLGQSLVSVDANDDRGSFQEKSEVFELPKVGQKRVAQNQENTLYKRQKMSESRSTIGSFMAKLSPAGIGHELAKDYAYDLQLSLNSRIKFLSPDNHNAYPLEPDIAIQVLSLLSLSFCVNPKTSLFISISKQVLSWIPWICKQATEKCFFSFDMLLYFKALQTVMLLRSFHPGDSKQFEDEAQLICVRSEDLDYPLYVDLISLLKRVWSDGHVSTQTCLDKLKCLVVQVIAKIGNRLNIDCDLELRELAIHSESVEVQNEALMSLPIIVLYSGPTMLGVMFKKLE
ncbi:hypothetical protein TRIUR3_17377 [Triticum urartu]|uniref:Uncharacterized protein n=1 Tax=Triticum urartu TaxID=4572 RepID=M7YLZ9_TRIUA|nr:hypothetical protein TRIUR3_17377 [Triticum urartu]